MIVKGSATRLVFAAGCLIAIVTLPAAHAQMGPARTCLFVTRTVLTTLAGRRTMANALPRHEHARTAGFLEAFRNRKFATHRWREADSNFWYGGTKARYFASIPAIADGSSTGEVVLVADCVAVIT
jgi:hypothetical protein